MNVLDFVQFIRSCPCASGRWWLFILLQESGSELERKSVKEYRDEIEAHLFYMFAQLY